MEVLDFVHDTIGSSACMFQGTAPTMVMNMMLKESTEWARIRHIVVRAVKSHCTAVSLTLNGQPHCYTRKSHCKSHYSKN